MRHNWIIDVLDDLRTFAARNDLSDLAQQLDKAAAVARDSETTEVSRAAVGAHAHGIRPRRFSAQG